MTKFYQPSNLSIIHLCKVTISSHHNLVIHHKFFCGVKTFKQVHAFGLYQWISFLKESHVTNDSIISNNTIILLKSTSHMTTIPKEKLNGIGKKRYI